MTRGAQGFPGRWDQLSSALWAANATRPSPAPALQEGRSSLPLCFPMCCLALTQFSRIKEPGPKRQKKKKKKKAYPVIKWAWMMASVPHACLICRKAIHGSTFWWCWNTCHRGKQGGSAAELQGKPRLSEEILAGTLLFKYSEISKNTVWSTFLLLDLSCQ